VRQDNHFAAVAEASQIGTFPGADSLVVVEIGTGIGAAMILNGTTIMGASGKFGRIAGWPVVTARRGVARSTLGESLVAGGLVEDYVRRGGQGKVYDGRTLFAAAAEGDVVADAVLAWAGREIAELVIRLQWLCDPTAIVLGGGLAGGFAILEPHLRPHLPAGIHLAPSRLGEATVLTGAVLSAMPFTETFVLQLLNETSFGNRAVRGQSFRKASA
jgi:predicted NBD/HSP70 family sugar kinase